MYRIEAEKQQTITLSSAVVLTPAALAVATSALVGPAVAAMSHTTSVHKNVSNVRFLDLSAATSNKIKKVATGKSEKGSFASIKESNSPRKITQATRLKKSSFV